MATALMDWRTITNDREKYSAYLCSREWCEKREAVRERSGGICERCCVRPMDACHHLTYERKYAERLEDLQAICTPCHEFTHGKINRDPAQDIPARLFGRDIYKVYLAGKFDSPNWRESILRGTRISAVREDGSCQIKDKGHTMSVIGPKFVEFHEHAGEGVGAHRSATHQCNHGTELATPRRQCFNNRATELLDSDLVFAWISCSSAFGTLVELGLSFGYSFGRWKKKSLSSVRAVAFSNRELLDEMWFAAETCDWVGVCKSPKQAWESLWRGDPSCISNGDCVVRSNEGF